MTTAALTETLEWKALSVHYDRIKNVHMRSLFASQAGRASLFTVNRDGIFFDYSKNIITEETVKLLLRLAEARGLPEKIEAMFSGEAVNVTENRAALHTALRNVSGEPVFCSGRNVMPGVREVLQKMRSFSGDIRSRKRTGFSGKPIRNIVNIGIGGSELGPATAVEALSFYADRRLRFFFVSNVDGAHISETLEKCDPEETLFIVASKTFTTEETMMNAETARKWLLDRTGQDPSIISRHFAAVSANEKAVSAFGIDLNNMFVFWDWVGGRYSLASAVGLSLMIAIGYEGFMSLLEGFHQTDTHFRRTDLDKNIPVLMALLGIWYNNFFGWHCYAVLPYSYSLRRLPAYLRQLDMESNGKSRDLSGSAVTYATGPVLFGEAGTNGQHSFYQLLHQGTSVIPADFIGFADSPGSLDGHHKKLMANMIAQSEALAFGRPLDEVKVDTPEALAPFKAFEGNRPSNSILQSRLAPKSLGRLIALYEHKIFTQGIIWNIDSFDQWGVELGKALAKRILKDMEIGALNGDYDESTASLMKFCMTDRSRENEI